MSVKFRVVPKKNPQNLLATPKFYANAVGFGKTDLDKLAKMISIQCTVTEADRYYSYRRDGVTGRMASLIWLESGPQGV